MSDELAITPAQVICVLGMHRSGTSVIARLLNLLGVNLGNAEHFHKPREDNPKGFWENGYLVQINDELLTRHGGTWDQPPVLPPDWQQSPGLEDCRQRARDLIRTDFNGAPTWGWKDPRACLTLPFWQQILPPMRYVLCLRNPLDVARSLHARDGLPVEKSTALWLTYVTAAIANTVGQPRLIVFYEDFMADGRSEVGQLAKFIGHSKRATSEPFARAMSEFVEQDLHHHRASAMETVSNPDLLFQTQSLYVALRLYRQLDQWERDPLLKKTIEQLSVLAITSQATDLQQHRQLSAVTQEAAGEKLRVQAVAAQLSEQQQAVQALLVERQQLVAVQERLTQEMARNDQAMQTQRAAVAALKQQSTQLVGERGQLVVWIEQLGQTHQDLQQALVAAQQRAREAAAHITEEKRLAQAALAERQRVISEQEQQLAQLTGERERLRAHVAQLEQAGQDLQQALVAAQQRAREAGARTAEEQRLAQAVRAERQQVIAEKEQQLVAARTLSAAECAQRQRAQAELELARAEMRWIKETGWWRLRNQWLALQRGRQSTRYFLLNVDYPGKKTVVGSSFSISGWCFATDDRGCKSVRARIGELTFDGVYGLFRPDVAQAHLGVVPVETAQTSGFEIPIQLAPGQYQIQLVALDQENHEHHLLFHAVKVAGRQS